MNEHNGGLEHKALAFHKAGDVAGYVEQRAAVCVFLKWANERDYTLVRWIGEEFSLRYAGSFGGPGKWSD